MNEYTKQANDFLEEAKATCKIEFAGCAKNTEWNEKEDRIFYNVTIETPRGKMEFVFWDSIHNTRIQKISFVEFARKYPKMMYENNYVHRAKLEKMLKEAKTEATPTAYDVLVCLTKYDPGTLEDFCSEYGYDTDSIKANKSYIAVIREYKQLERIFTPEQMEKLQEIQ